MTEVTRPERGELGQTATNAADAPGTAYEGSTSIASSRTLAFATRVSLPMFFMIAMTSLRSENALRAAPIIARPAD